MTRSTFTRPFDEKGPVRSTALALVAMMAAVHCGIVGCAPQAIHPTDDAEHSGLPLEAFVITPVDSTGLVQARVRVQVPHRSLIFHRDPTGDFVSGLVVQVTAWRDGIQAGGGVRTDTVQVPDFTATRSDRELRVDVPVTVRGEGAVELVVRATVIETVRWWRRQLSYSPRAAARMPVYVAGVHTNLESAGSGDFVLSEEDTLQITTVLRRVRASATWPTSGLYLVAETKAAGQSLPLRLRRELRPSSAGDALHLSLAWPASELPFGRLELALALEAELGQSVERLPHEPPLDLINLRVPFSVDRGWKRHVMWLEGRLSDGAVDSLRNVPAPDRAAAWRRAWQSIGTVEGRAPAAAERAHLLRIVAADERFGQFGRGALSDRGRVFVRYGEPDRIERYGDDLTRAGIWEVWAYRDLGRRFFFYDVHGVGDYRLSEERSL